MSGKVTIKRRNLLAKLREAWFLGYRKGLADGRRLSA
jgi:hypothetical protein